MTSEGPHESLCPEPVAPSHCSFSSRRHSVASGSATLPPSPLHFPPRHCLQDRTIRSETSPSRFGSSPVDALEKQFNTFRQVAIQHPQVKRSIKGALGWGDVDFGGGGRRPPSRARSPFRQPLRISRHLCPVSLYEQPPSSLQRPPSSFLRHTGSSVSGLKEEILREVNEAVLMALQQNEQRENARHLTMSETLAEMQHTIQQKHEALADKVRQLEEQAAAATAEVESMQTTLLQMQSALEARERVPHQKLECPPCHEAAVAGHVGTVPVPLWLPGMTPHGSCASEYASSRWTSADQDMAGGEGEGPASEPERWSGAQEIESLAFQDGRSSDREGDWRRGEDGNESRSSEREKMVSIEVRKCSERGRVASEERTNTHEQKHLHPHGTTKYTHTHTPTDLYRSRTRNLQSCSTLCFQAWHRFKSR